MGKRVVGALLLGCILAVPAAIVASTESAPAADYETISQNLQGKVATIELEDGSAIKKAKKVVLEPNFTYWEANGKQQKIETGKVVRIRAKSKSRGLIGLGAGAAVGAYDGGANTHIPNPQQFAVDIQEISGLITRSDSRMTPDTKLAVMFCMAKPSATANTAPAANKAVRSIPAIRSATKRPAPRIR